MSKIKRTIELFDNRFLQQKQFIKHTSRLKALFCTRRAAKSFTAGLYMVYEALTHPNCNVLFVGLTRSSAWDIIYKDILQVLNRTHKLGMKLNLAKQTLTFPNGSLIAVTGVDVDELEMNKLLGRKYRLVCIDEASMYTINLKHLVYDILTPAMADQDGIIALFGTASNMTRGLFYDITNGLEAGWELFTWSAYDNPFINWAKTIDEIKEKRPLYMETPQFKQWFLNEWVVETDKLVYKFNAERNLCSSPPVLPATGWTYILGVDTGWEDDNAFVLSGFHANDPNLYIIKTYNKDHMTFDQVVDKINEFMHDPIYSPAKVIIDGANKQGVESMKQRAAGIPFEYADKTGKVDFIEMLNGDLIQGKIKINTRCTTLVDELMGLIWVSEGEKIKLPKKEHPALSNHLCDAFLYAWRNGYHYHSSPTEKVVVVGSKDWYAQQAVDMWEKEREKLINDSNPNHWPSSSGPREDDDGGGWGRF